eukprot:TRINITY_DN762_c0_g2_i1.p1 TRINITY_DN762_c0_g2~~TRINITY_DN762_c0_g2_i1.p1  ORF type:complete len:626 (+),score=39.20 TRINITY_DN762_c0_g2_i1:115-1992(+)
MARTKPCVHAYCLVVVSFAFVLGFLLYSLGEAPMARLQNFVRRTPVDSQHSSREQRTPVDSQHVSREQRIARRPERVVSRSSKGPWVAFLFAGAPRALKFKRVQHLLRLNVLQALAPSGSYNVFVRMATNDASANGGYNSAGEGLNASEIIDVLQVTSLETFEPGSEQEARDFEAMFPSDVHRVVRKLDPKRYSMWFSRMMVYRQAKTFEATSGIKYDWFVHVRMDMFAGYPLRSITNFDRKQIQVLSMWTWSLPDTFAIIPSNIAPAYYDLDTLVHKDVFCFGGPGQSMDEKLFMPKEKCNSVEFLKRSGLNDKTIPIAIARCCPNTDRGGSEVIYHQRIKRAGIKHTFMQALLTTIRLTGEINRLSPNEMNGYARNVAGFKTMASWAMDVSSSEVQNSLPLSLSLAHPPESALDAPLSLRPDGLHHYLPFQILALVGDERKLASSEVLSMISRWQDPKLPYNLSWQCLVEANKRLALKRCSGAKQSWDMSFDPVPFMFFAEHRGPSVDSPLALRRPARKLFTRHEDKCVAVSSVTGDLEIRRCSGGDDDPEQQWTATLVAGVKVGGAPAMPPPIYGPQRTKQQRQDLKRIGLLGARAWKLQPPSPLRAGYDLFMIQHLSFPDY